MAKKNQRDYGNLESVFGNIQKPKSLIKDTTTYGCKNGEKRFTTILSIDQIDELKTFCKDLGLPVKDVVAAALSKYLKEKKVALEAKQEALEEQRALMKKLQEELLE